MLAARPLVLTICLATAAVLAGCMAPPEGLSCRADSEGNHLSWEAVENATSNNVYRMLGDTDDVLNATLIGSSEDTSFTDPDVEEGQTYTYWVTAVGPWDEETLDTFEEAEIDESEIPPNESVPSEPCVVTAVPFFTTPIVGAVALAGCVGAYVVLRRK